MTPEPVGPPSGHGRGPLLISAAAFSLGAAAIYLVVLPAHLQASLAQGLFFAIVGTAQVILAIGLLTAPTRRRVVAAAALGLAVLALWALAHTVGLPGPNPWQPLDTVVGITDSVCAILELLATLLLWYSAARLRRGPLVRRRVLVALASLPPLLLGASLTFGGMALASDGFTSFTRAGGPLPGSVPAGKLTTATYCTQDGTPLAMDIYEPPASAARPTPVALYVHGGGWVLGSRKLGGGLGAKVANSSGALVPRLRPALNQRGFVVASIDYRLGGSSRWPSQLEDAKCAVRFLRANAGRLGIDPDRIGAWGSSAGGDLVSLLGVVGPQAGYDHGQYADQSSRVQAVVDMFGAADLTDLHDTDPFMRAVIQLALGGSTSARRSASPADYLDGVAGGGVRFLLLQGTADTAHPARHAQAFARALQAAGVPVQLVIVQGANHTLNDPAQRPSPDQVTGMVADFFTRSLTSSSGR